MVSDWDWDCIAIPIPIQHPKAAGHVPHALVQSKVYPIRLKIDPTPGIKIRLLHPIPVVHTINWDQIGNQSDPNTRYWIGYIVGKIM
jgi:hypothetical protein